MVVVEMVDSTGIIDYGWLIYIALQRSKTAREAIKVIDHPWLRPMVITLRVDLTVCRP